MSAVAEPAPLRRDAGIIALVGGAHLVSHFFQLLLAPLFPWLRDAFELTYAELGFIMTVLFVISAAGQALAGFVVDRFGALMTLNSGLACLSIGAVIIGAATGYPMLLLGAVFVGLGNAVFHPVDFWLLNHRVSESRLGPAFSVHGLTGSLGWAAAPVFLVGIAVNSDWRTAIFAAAGIPLVIIAMTLRHHHLLAPDAPEHDLNEGPSQAEKTSQLGFLRLPEIWFCFSFFALVSAALGGIQSFSPTVFEVDYGFTLTMAAMSVTIYMLASAAGMLTGGWLVYRSQALERNIAVALILAAGSAFAVASELVPSMVAMALMAVMGFGSGLSGPSRDMLIRRAAPVGATGRVYGVVYSGLDAGLAVGPVCLGRLLDRGAVGEIFYFVGGFLLLATVVAWRVSGVLDERATGKVS